jgi:hypothetical protein
MLSTSLRGSRATFQIASNLNSRLLIRPNAESLVLAGGTGSLKRESTLHFYNWVAREFDNVYTLLNDNEAYDVYELVLPSNVHVLNQGVHRIGTSLITGQSHSTPNCVDIRVFRGYPRCQQVEYAPISIFQRGVDWSQKNKVLCLANDARHLLFDPTRVVHIQ